jgi:3-oxoacyl-[acyl-carrier protein] reductase
LSLLDLTGKVALVTGSTRGIGWRTAEMLAEHGATLVIHGRTDQATVDARAAELGELFGGVHSGVLADVRDPDQIRAALRQVFSTYKRLDILVNNAGILDDALIGMVSDESITKTFETNTISSIHFLQGGARLMKRAGAGSIINIASIIGVEGNAGQIVYSSSKAALLGLTKSAAKELAASGIRVNAIAPGFIDTEMARSIPPEIFEQRVASIAMARIGTADDVARAILFLASDLSEYITGQVIGVDGGMVIS